MGGYKGVRGGVGGGCAGLEGAPRAHKRAFGKGKHLYFVCLMNTTRDFACMHIKVKTLVFGCRAIRVTVVLSMHGIVCAVGTRGKNKGAATCTIALSVLNSWAKAPWRAPVPCRAFTI